jgi:hypothetical protein
LALDEYLWDEWGFESKIPIVRLDMEDSLSIVAGLVEEVRRHLLKA